MISAISLAISAPSLMAIPTSAAESAGGVYRRRSGRIAGRTGSCDAGRDVPDAGALYRTGSGLFAF